MKILINENKVDKLIGNWLETEFGGLGHKVSVNYPDQYYFIKNGNVVMDYYGKYSRLCVDDNIVNFIIKMFGKSWVESKDIVGEWFQNSYNLDVNFLTEPLSSTRTIWEKYSDN